jgi:hypothetical protein
MARSIWKKRFKNLTATTGNTRHHCCHHLLRPTVQYHYPPPLPPLLLPPLPPPTTTNLHQPPPTTTIRADTSTTTFLSISFFFRCRLQPLSGYISFRQFRRKLHKLGCHIETTEMASLHESVAGGSGGDHKISVKEFFNFVQHGANDVVAIAKRLRRNLKSKSSIKGNNYFFQLFCFQLSLTTVFS